MGFWSTVGKIGKVALPIALAATGVGAPAAIAIMAGEAAAEKKIKGGSWGDALKAGAVGGATQAVTGGIGGAFGGAAKGAAGAAAKTGIKAGLMAGAKGALTSTALGAAGSVIGAMGQSAAANRGEKDTLNIHRDQTALQGISQFENAQQQRALLEMKQREEQRIAQEQAYKLAMRSALAKNTQDAAFNTSGFHSNVPNISFSGGARPSALGPEGREAAAVMNNQAMQQLMGPPPLTTLPTQERFQQSEPTKASIWEKLAGPVGLGLTAVGAGLDARNKGVPAIATDVNDVPPAAQPPINPSIFRNVRF